MQINVTCPNCEEHLIIEVEPTSQENETNNYADAVDLICAVAWESINECFLN